MKYISCWCMLTFCSYQYLIEISMYWKVRSAWAWFKSKWIFSKKKPNNNRPQCCFKDLIDSKDKCECKNGIPSLGWLKGSSLKKDLEHLCFWSSSLRPGQEESCVMCACWALPKKKKKNTLPNPGTVWSEIDGRNAWVTWARTVSSFLWPLPCGCVWWSLSVCLPWALLPKCLVVCALCAPPPHPPPSFEALGDSMPTVWNSACAFAALRSAGFLWVWGSLSVFLFLSLPPCCFFFVFSRLPVLLLSTS